MADVKHFFYTNDILDELEASLSTERLSAYLYAVGGNREKAIRLHVWNTEDRMSIHRHRFRGASTH